MKGIVLLTLFICIDMGMSTKRLIFIGFACQSNEIEATFLKRYSDYAYQETVNLYKGDPSSGNLIMNIQKVSVTDESSVVAAITLDVRTPSFFMFFAII